MVPSKSYSWQVKNWREKEGSDGAPGNESGGIGNNKTSKGERVWKAYSRNRRVC